MSLTSLLGAHRDVAAQLSGLATGPPPSSVTSPMIAPPITNHFALVGTAFDYLLRFEIRRRFGRADVKRWVAEAAVDQLEDAGVRSHSAARSLLNRISKVVEDFASTESPSQDIFRTLAGDAIRLAKLDPIYRAGVFDPTFDVADPDDVRDLLALLAAVPFNGEFGRVLQGRILLNPTFGAFSNVVRGADADLLTSVAIIDFKTTKDPKFRPALPQIIGYGVLARLYHDREDPSFPVPREIGVYFCRHGEVRTISFEDIIRNPGYELAAQALLHAAATDFGTDLEASLALRATNSKKSPTAPERATPRPGGRGRARGR